MVEDFLSNLIGEYIFEGVLVWLLDGFERCVVLGDLFVESVLLIQIIEEVLVDMLEESLLFVLSLIFLLFCFLLLQLKYDVIFFWFLYEFVQILGIFLIGLFLVLVEGSFG